MNSFQDVFISYGRKDSLEFATKLNQQLVQSGLEVWFDFDDIPVGVDWQKQIDDGIDKADNFLFIISPHAVNSQYCRLEIDLAVQRRKRIIPLMHVERISRETWQERNPGGTEEEWAAYQAAGGHDHYMNMHPIIRKINWVNFREGIDDFEQSFQKLLNLLDRDRDYVHQHTVLLSQALEWEHNNRHPQNLLVDASLQQAEGWLKTRFRDRQPPCSPTEQHCRFISESLKYAQDGMTDVFICHAEEDRDTLAKIYLSLTHSGRTVWTNWYDIQMGVDFKEAIERGIEAADNIVYLVSPAALKSSWCQREIQYALSLNKRIIPILVSPVDTETLPTELKYLHFVNLTDNVNELDYVADQQDLLNALNQDASYYRAHKLLLVTALKWERQLQNPCVLLQGRELQQTTAWLEMAKNRTDHRPVSIQENFVEASLQQPTDVRLNVFIASSAQDLRFARKLYETLQIQGERTWFEPDKTAVGEHYVAQAKEGIERAENVVVVVSQEGLQDATVLEELRFADALSKRVIAVSYQAGGMSLVRQLKEKLAEQAVEVPIQAGERSPLPTALAASPWVDFSERDGDFMVNFGVLYRMLKSYPQHVYEHTRLLIRALSWQEADQDDSLLLRGKELLNAERWLAKADHQTPKPSDLQIKYIRASRELSLRQVKPRTVLGWSMGITLLILVARFSGWLQGVELAAYDHLLRQRLYEDQDDRFLIVSVDGSSGNFLRQRIIDGDYERGIGTVPDSALDEALTILSDNGARLIGLDFYRDFPADDSVKQTLQETDNLIGVCKAQYEEASGVPAEDIPPDRVGFADFVNDPTSDNFVRRHHLMQAADPEFCNTPIAFSLLLASRYLQQEGNPVELPINSRGDFDAESPLRLGDLLIPRIDTGKGPYYKNPDTLNGYQTLLNFRRSKEEGPTLSTDPSNFAPEVSLQALLMGEVPPELIADRIVLIGYVDLTDRSADYYQTPYGDMPGVFVQGQMTSQLLSAALKERPLIRWWPTWQELLWILGWAIVGGTIVRYGIRVSRTAIALTSGVAVLYVICYGAMVFGSTWIPLMPPLATFTLTAGTIAILNYRLRSP